MDPNKQTLNEIARLARENNQMLHAMRRSAFFWGFMKFLIYIVIFAAPIWFYIVYVSGTLDDLVTALHKAQGTQAKAEAKFEGFEDAIKNLKDKLPAFMQPHDSASSSAQ